MAENSPITYQYQGASISAALARHLFRYLSAVSGIEFIEDSRSPHIFLGGEQAIPLGARIFISNEKQSSHKIRIRDLSSAGWLYAINYDPLEVLASKLSFRGKSGPYSSRPPTPSGPNEKTVSAIVTEFIDILCRANLIEDRMRAVALWEEPFRFGMAITHDIDIARRSVPGSLRLLVNRELPGGWAALYDSFKAGLRLAPNPYNEVDNWIKLEGELGLNSTYFIFDGLRRHSFDPKYKPDELSKALDKLSQNGHEIALHTSVECYSGDGILEAASRLRRSAKTKVVGLRPHFLSAYYPEYWRAATEAGFAYSSSIGFDNDIGYLDGLDLPFYPFDAINNEAIALLEVPIAIMDCGLIGEHPATSEKVFERAMTLIDSASATGGLIVLDWHQRTFYNRDYPGWSELFTKIVHYARGKGAGFFRLDELAKDFGKRIGI